MKYLVAVSGGIDSVVLLHRLAMKHEHELIVAHFDHGIRSDSQDDARFVEGLAKKYDFPFVTTREVLGPTASEQYARERRYAFLNQVAKEQGATIATAHHADDVIETMAINLKRGTGWRGIAVLSNPAISRPLRHTTKQAIRDYAHRHHLEWVEDSTNATDAYLRNRVRRRLAQLSAAQKHELLRIYQHQRELATIIDEQVASELRDDHTYDRYLLTNSHELPATEVLRRAIMAVGGASPTRPQLERALLAIKTARAGTIFEVGGGVCLAFTTRSFIVRTS